MKYVIFGAGETGEKALGFLGYHRVYCFVDNYLQGKNFEKPIINFTELMNMSLEEYIIVIASEKYYLNIERQLLENNIKKYFIYHETDPQIWNQVLPHYNFYKHKEVVSYNRILGNKDISRYQKISILGTNLMLPYLISEVAFQNAYKNIVEIISDEEYEAKQYMGIPCVTWEEADKNIDCLIINVKRCQAVHADDYDDTTEFDVIDLYDVDWIEPSFYHPELEKYKNIHRGERVFLIGTGPSLKIEDLDKLHQHHEICIGFNKVYRAYDQTAWRADYIGMYDQNIVEDYIQEADTVPGVVFVGDSYHYERPDIKVSGIQYYHCNNTYKDFYPNKPKFSKDFTQGFYEGYTATYSIGIQLAAYMGFEKIYLLGVDHSYKNGDATDANNHFISSYIRKDEAQKYKAFPAVLEKSIKSYERAELYSRYHGFRIFNATRGGKLEVFERVDFDSLF